MKKKLEQHEKFLINVEQVDLLNFCLHNHLNKYSFIKIGIGSLFKKIGCDRRQIEHLLQSHEGVTEDNMLRYLGIIEERTNELLTAQATIIAKVIN
jgi:hypothetical protein